MSTPLNSRLRALAAWASLLLLLGLGLAAAGCSDHGPVNLFAPELFNKNVGAPVLGFGSASSISFTTQAPDVATHGTTCATNLNCFSQYGSFFGVAVTLVNTGGAGTYGPVQVTFSSSDPLAVFYVNNPATSKYATAVSSFGSGNEILANSQTSVSLEQGWSVNGSLYFNSTGLSFQFYYGDANPADYGQNPYRVVTVPITMAIADGLGNNWTSTFDIYVTQE